MNKRVLFGSCATVFAVSLLASPQMASAQTVATAAAAAAPAASTPSDATQVPEVIVTANRREERLQKVPITVDATSGVQLQQRQITSTQELSDFTPGFNVTRANAGAVPFLRGVGTFTATVGNEAAVATYIDDVYRPAAGASNYQFNDVSRVEVLVGPQGTLFGRNAAGGVVNVITRDPTQNERVDAQIGYGNYNTVTASVYAGGGIAPNLAADISVYFENQADGWGKNLYDGTQAYTSKALSFHTKWIWTPTDRDKVTFVAFQDREYNQQGAASNVIPGTINAAGYGAAPGFFNVDTNKDGFDDTKAFGGILKYEHDFGSFNFTSITSGQEADWDSMIENDSSPADFQEAHVNAKESTYQQEFRIASEASSEVQWVTSLYWFRDRSNPDPFTQYGTGLKAPNHIQFTYSVQNTTSYAAFGQATFPIWTDTHLTLGLRYSNDDRHIDGATYCNPCTAAVAATMTTPAIPATYTLNASPPGGYSTSAGAPTYRASLDHNFTPDIMGYVSYNRGFKSGNYNTNTATQPPTKPETLDAFEAGAKTNLLDRRLEVDASVFYDKMYNLQVQQQLSTGTFQTNAGAARYQGVDLAIVARPVEHFTLTLSAEALDAKYSSYANAQFFMLNTTTDKVVALPAGSAAGYELPFADKFTSSLTGRYEINMDTGQVALVGVVGYHSGFHFDTQGLVQQPEYTVANASIVWTSMSGKYDVTLWGDNLTNTHYYAQKQISTTGETYSPAAPLTFGIKFGYHMK